MRHIFTLILCVIGAVCPAQQWEERQMFGAADSAEVLRVLSSTDTALFAPILQSFVQKKPDVAIDYVVSETAEIDRFVRLNPEEFDVVISSAMDLQFKLANDGFARRLQNLDVPAWAQWRRSLFAFTSEPAAIVINRAAFERLKTPQTRQDLIRVLRDNPEVFQQRVGTYDVRQSGLGYLFATQDARSSETYWRLTEVMGNLQARLYCCSGDMIKDVADGTIAVAYNVLGSYALARSDLGEKIEVVLPSDFQTIMMRTALVSAQSERPGVAARFVAHLFARLENNGASEALPLTRLDFAKGSIGQSTIALEPALLTYLDLLKRRQFLAAWEDAIIQ